jgi:chaperonin GroEL (HSP60 family)
LKLSHPISQLSDKNTLGFSKIVETCYIAELPFIKISGCDWFFKIYINVRVSIILRAPTPVMLNECERSLHDSICVLNEILKCKRVVGGAGCLYIEIAKRIRKEMFNYKNKIQLVMESFAISLETIPILLSQNGGFDSSKILTELRFKHQEENGIWYGIDMNTGEVAEMLKCDENILRESLNLQH